MGSRYIVLAVAAVCLLVGACADGERDQIALDESPIVETPTEGESDRVATARGLVDSMRANVESLEQIAERAPSKRALTGAVDSISAIMKNHLDTLGGELSRLDQDGLEREKRKTTDGKTSKRWPLVAMMVSLIALIGFGAAAWMAYVLRSDWRDTDSRIRQIDKIVTSHGSAHIANRTELDGIKGSLGELSAHIASIEGETGSLRSRVRQISKEIGLDDGVSERPVPVETRDESASAESNLIAGYNRVIGDKSQRSGFEVQFKPVKIGIRNFQSRISDKAIKPEFETSEDGGLRGVRFPSSKGPERMVVFPPPEPFQGNAYRSSAIDCLFDIGDDSITRTAGFESASMFLRIEQLPYLTQTGGGVWKVERNGRASLVVKD